MTNTPTPPATFGRRTLPKASDFAPLDRRPNTSRNMQRGTPPRRKTRTIL